MSSSLAEIFPYADAQACMKLCCSPMYNASFLITHCRLNRLSHTIYWKSPISILGTSGYEIYIFLEKNG